MRVFRHFVLGLILASGAVAEPEGLLLSVNGGYAALKGAAVLGGDQEVPVVGAEVTFATPASKGSTVETGIYGDFRRVRVAGSTEPQDFNAGGIVSRVHFGGAAGFFFDVKLDAISTILAMLDADDTNQEAFFKVIGIGVGLGIRLPLGKKIYLAPRIGFQTFRYTFPLQPTLPPRTSCYEATMALTLDL